MNRLRGKCYILLIYQILILVASCSKSHNNDNSESNIVYSVRDIGPAGGLIFYDKGYYSDGWRYLEASPSDLCTNIQWYNGHNYVTGANGTDIGTGKENTKIIVNSQGSGYYAAMICDSFIINEYDDWFLPSKDELNLIYTNLCEQKIGNFNCTWYWSSSEYDYFQAWLQIFEYGGQGWWAKCGVGYNNLGVRAVRAF